MVPAQASCSTLHTSCSVWAAQLKIGHNSQPEGNKQIILHISHKYFLMSNLYFFQAQNAALATMKDDWVLAPKFVDDGLKFWCQKLKHISRVIIKKTGNVLARMQRVHKLADFWDTTFWTRWFWGFYYYVHPLFWDPELSSMHLHLQIQIPNAFPVTQNMTLYQVF